MTSLLWEGSLSDLGYLRDAFTEGIVPTDLGIVSFPNGKAKFFMEGKNENIKANFLAYYGKWANAKSYYVPRGLPYARISDVLSYIDPSIFVTSYLGYYLICSPTYLPEDLKILFEEGSFIYRLPKNRGLLDSFAASLCSEAFSFRYPISYRNGALYVNDCSREIFLRIIEKFEEILLDVITAECEFVKIQKDNVLLYPYKSFSYNGDVLIAVSKGEALIEKDYNTVREDLYRELRKLDYLDWKILDGLSLLEMSNILSKKKEVFDIPLEKEESKSFSNITAYFYTTTLGSKVPIARVVNSRLDIPDLFREGFFFSNLFKNMFRDYSVIIEQDPINVIDQLKE